MRKNTGTFFVMTAVLLCVWQKVDLCLDKKMISSKQLQELSLFDGTAGNRDILSARARLWSIPSYEADKCSVAERRFVDLNGDGKEDIVALINLQCTADPAEVFVVCRIDSGAIVQRFSSERAAFDGTVRDVDGDGRYELLLKSVVSNGNTPHFKAVYWVDVYSWEGTGYTISNRRFMESYYLRIYLPSIVRRIAEAERIIRASESPADERLALGILSDCRKALTKVVELSRRKVKESSGSAVTGHR